MNLVVSLYVALLFVLLTPGILLTLPKGGKKLTVAVVHGLVFAVVYHFTNKMVWRLSVSMDGFAGDAAPATMTKGPVAASATAAKASAAAVANKRAQRG